MNAEARFWAKVDIGEGCWIWLANKTADGYGLFHRSVEDGRSLFAHRYSYVLHFGPIPEGFQIDHLCRVPSCVRPDHLEAVTARENTLRGFGPTAMNARKAFCKHGHPFDATNTYVTNKGRRICRICAAGIQRRKWARRRALRRMVAA